jgi:exonuclease I
MSNSPNVSAMETVLGEWKNYLARLEQKPINTFTTTEIISLFNKEELKESLQEVDRSIYSGIMAQDPVRALAVLKKFSNKRYKKRRKEVKNER